MIAVVDARVAAKWFLSDRPDEQHANLALQILEQSVLGFLQLVQPPDFVADERYYSKARAEGQMTLLADFSLGHG